MREGRFGVRFGGLDTPVKTAVALGHDFHVKKKVQTFSLYCFLTSNFKEKLTANSLLAAFYVNNELYDNYIGESLQEIDDTIHALPNMMKGAETWISPFSKHERTVILLWPHYCFSKGKMVEVIPQLHVEAPDAKEFLVWKDKYRERHCPSYQGNIATML